MTLRLKTLLIVGFTLMTLIIVLYCVSLLILQRSYLQLEEEAILSDAQRVLNALTDDLDRLDSTAADWAHWDETYSFIQFQNDFYIEDNLAPETLVNLDLNMMLYFDSSDELVHSAFIDIQSGEPEPLPQSIADYFSPESQQLALEDAESQLAGIFNVPEREATVMYAARPILTNEGEGPKQGSLILGYYLDKERVQTLSRTLDMTIEAYPLGDSQLPDDVEAARQTLTKSGDISQHIDGDIVHGYGLINDADGNPALIVRVEMPRDIYQQGQTSLQYFLVSLLILGGASAAATLLLIEKMVLSRLTTLSQNVAVVRQTGDLKTPIQVVGKDELSSLAAGVKDLLADLNESQHKLRSINEDLEKRVEARTTELVTANQQLEQEVAERQQAQIELAQARDQALEALRIKAQILANVSHDARTPLSVITLSVEGFKTGRYGDVSEKQRKALDRIDVSVQDLIGFVSNLLEGSELESNQKIQPINNLFDPNDLLQEVSSIIKSLAERKGLRFKSHVSDSVDPSLYGDKGRLKQILNNLATNAIKFTNEGTITISIHQPDSTHWTMQVADTGIGIKEDALNTIFDAFWQVDGSMTRELGRGIGLGLSIVRELTQLMGGEVTVQSVPGKGSVFTVVLPIIHPTSSNKGQVNE